MAFGIDRRQIIRRDRFSPRSRALRNRNGDVYVVPHHAVNYTVFQTLDTFNNPNRFVSANIACGPEKAGVDRYVSVEAVDVDTMRAATTSSGIDDLAITTEFSNMRLVHPYPVGASGKSDLVQQIVDAHLLYGMKITRSRVQSHRDVYKSGWGSYATACPGDDLQNYIPIAIDLAAEQVATGAADMRLLPYHRTDAFVSRPNRTLAPGKGLYLNQTTDLTSHATNIVGGSGPYSITTHVYAEGTPGDVIETVLLWDDTKTSGSHSPHFIERIQLDSTGRAKVSTEYKRAVNSGYAVYLRVDAVSTNKAPVKITNLSSDAYLFAA